MSYDGVRLNGILHESRMRDVFQRRQRLMFSCVLTIVMAILSNDENKDKVVGQLRNLAEEMFPGEAKKRLKREEYFANILRTREKDSYTVEALFEG